MNCKVYTVSETESMMENPSIKSSMRGWERLCVPIGSEMNKVYPDCAKTGMCSRTLVPLERFLK
ncbi:MAG: hypothetical protein AMDU4_FER2C00318G0002 [Ferroplasma sp. Type II]|nr:MAG: hypothetical protein AMDU4_FER2C00318G0002 [Ferroplasma sp. Type II]